MDDTLSGFRDQLSRLTAKLNEQRRTIATLAPSSVSIKFELDNDIKTTEEEIRKVQQQIQQEETWKTYEALLRLNYLPQYTLYKKLKNKPATAFLIHGNADHGQLWLLHRLLQNFNGKRILISAARRAPQVDLLTVWRELGHGCGLPIGASSDLIAGKVCKLLETQDVVLLFLSVNWMPAEWLSDLLQHLWQPLVEKVEQSGSTECKKQLIMFLIDEVGKTAAGSVEFAAVVDEKWHPATPVALPRLEAFTSEVVTGWLENSPELPLELTEEPAGVAKKLIADSSNGTPERFFDRICEKCGGDWYAWLEYQ